MPIKNLTPQEEIDRRMQRGVQGIEKALVYTLSVIGERVVNHARSLPSPSPAAFKDGRIPPHQPHYIDRSANLRSSIGYVVSLDGAVAGMSDFDPVKGGDEGARNGREYALRLVSKFPRGVALIVVAGERYAAYVSAKGYDVIDTAELLARRLEKDMLRQLGLT